MGNQSSQLITIVLLGQHQEETLEKIKRCVNEIDSKVMVYETNVNGMSDWRIRIVVGTRNKWMEPYSVHVITGIGHGNDQIRGALYTVDFETHEDWIRTNVRKLGSTRDAERFVKND
jgi:hypothetical protein